MIIAITTNKGGTGKTTVTINLAVGLAHRGYEVCIIDADVGQFSALKWAKYRDDEEKQISVVQVQKEKLNREAKALSKRYDVILIDGRPTQSEVGDRIVMASDIVVIPLMPSLFDLEAFKEYLPQFSQVKDLKEEIGGRVEGYALLNGLIVNSSIKADIEQAVRMILKKNKAVQLLESQLMRRVVYGNSPTNGLGVIEESDKKAKAEVNSLLDEMEKIIRNFTYI